MVKAVVETPANMEANAYLGVNGGESPSELYINVDSMLAARRSVLREAQRVGRRKSTHTKAGVCGDSVFLYFSGELIIFAILGLISMRFSEQTFSMFLQIVRD